MWFAGDPEDLYQALADLLPERPPWMADALCREYPDLPWVPRNGKLGEGHLAAMRRVCSQCLVFGECAMWSITMLPHDDAGIWAGMLPSERRRRAA